MDNVTQFSMDHVTQFSMDHVTQFAIGHMTHNVQTVYMMSDQLFLILYGAAPFIHFTKVCLDLS